MSWKGFSPRSLHGHRVLYAWPDRKHLNELRDADAEALVVIELEEDEAAEWVEEDKLQADMMNRPDRWRSITVEQVRVKCRELGMWPNDIDTVVGCIQHRKEGRRSNVQSSYRTFQFK